MRWRPERPWIHSARSSSSSQRKLNPPAWASRTTTFLAPPAKQPSTQALASQVMKRRDAW
jgi:hypothetical protein